MVPAARGCPRRRGGRHQLPPSIPRLPGIIPVALSTGFSCRRASALGHLLVKSVHSILQASGGPIPEFPVYLDRLE